MRKIIVGIGLFCFVIYIAFLIAALIVDVWYRVEPTQQKVWVDYEVKILDSDKVVLFRSDDVTDSLVFRCNIDIFIGTQAIEKLEYEKK